MGQPSAHPAPLADGCGRDELRLPDGRKAGVIPATTRASEPPLAELVRLEDPEFYLDAHPVYDRMRREQPVYYYAPLDIFVLTRYADMREAARRPDLFTSAHGSVL